MRTAYAVWELTLKCNLACVHCGSRAGEARHAELTTAEALDLVGQLAAVGIREVTLIGGEAFLRPDWLDIVREIVRRGMTCSLTTGGYGISARTAQRARDAGLDQVVVSIDGLEATHDRLRGKSGSWRQCFETLARFRDVRLPVGANTQINRLSAPEIPEILSILKLAGIGAWQVQLTVPMGNAADNWELLLQPDELLTVFPVLAETVTLARQAGIEVYPGNNIGYFGPFESLFRRGPTPDATWRGCSAGLNTLGIEADGSIKGCPSLPSAHYIGGNIRERRLHDIVGHAPEITFNLNAAAPEATDHLWGFCRTCEHARACRGGCTWTAHVFFNRPGNNPYCHHRALKHAERGLRERFFPVQAAAGLPFDNGVFEIVTEPL